MGTPSHAGNTASVSLPDPASLNYFEHSPEWLTRRLASRDVANALETALTGEVPERKVVSTRYGQGLRDVPRASLMRVHRELVAYMEAASPHG